MDERYFEKQLFVAKFESSFREIRRRFEKGGKSRARCTSGKFRERGAYWKVLRSIKSFSRVIITRHWFKPISPDDSSSSNFWRLHSSLYPSPVRSIDDPNALRVGRRQLDAQKNAPRSDSPLNPYLSYTPLNSWLTILFASTISFLFYYLESIQDNAELGMEKLFREEINEVDSIRQTQVRQTWRNFLKILIKKKPDIFSTISVYKIKYFRMCTQLTIARKHRSLEHDQQAKIESFHFSSVIAILEITA